MLAYGLIAAIAIVGSIAGLIWSRKNKARKRRLRGIKSYTPASERSAAR
ncbi:hypothetical protein SAMN05216382_0159 [Sphingomonas palmae]|uniref:Uncharacterized protein n=1 Tax=Sphingomonas palmae TaxID=1855283 RepID=A0A1H7FY76_9SPHN|nr:hypothetical protein SAMN05216382_0159 [Sphingomonas palmae]